MFTTKSGHCSAFLSNYHWDTSVKVTFNKMHYDLPPWSISILPDCKTVAFNTGTVSSHRQPSTFLKLLVISSLWISRKYL